MKSKKTDGIKEKKEKQELEKHIEQWKEKYLRALADYQNLEKRTTEEIQRAKLYAAEEVLKQFLPIMDTVERAQTHIQDEGLALGLAEMEMFLKDQGVKHIEVLGKPFDPHYMECIEVIKGKPNIVMEEVLKGYTLRGKVLRVAQVNVGKK